MAADWTAAPETPGLTITWPDGWTEVFPEDEFAEECEDRPRRIFMYERTSPRRVSEYSLNVWRHVATLNYGGALEAVDSHREFNRGDTKITFTDATRTSVFDVAWRRKGDKKFFPNVATASWAVESWAVDLEGTVRQGPFVPAAGDRRPRGTLEVVLRPGQLRFRRLLLQAYDCCCVSGCRFRDTLEAAHIMPYKGPSFDHVQNGLLLRADLHRLYDQLLFSIDPGTFTVRASRFLRNSDYAWLEGVAFRRPQNSQCAPSQKALQDHWDRFNRVAWL